MVCSLPHTIENFRAYVKKQCDEDDAARQKAIIGVITLFEQAMVATEDLKKQYAKCEDISPKRRDVIEKFLDDEAWKDYEVKKTLLSCMSKIQDNISHKIRWMNKENK
ncbi:hypothetical protein Tco_1176111 [Tanacetum coccineum]